MGSYTEHRRQDSLGGSPEGTKVNIQDMELREEWQDEELPRPLPEDMHELQSSTEEDRLAPPSSLALTGGKPSRKRLVAPTLSLTLDHSGSLPSDDLASAALSPSVDDDLELELNLDAMETPSDSESGTFPESLADLEWEDDLPRTGRARCPALMDHTDTGQLELDQVDNQGRRWRRFCIGGQECHVNMSVLEPYLQVLSHGGYYGENTTAIVVFSSCYLPENTIEDYQYVMDNLFRYIIGTLDLMVSENYVMVYLCGMAPRSKMPNVKWLRQCYLTIDRRLRKNLKNLFVVHPVWYIKAILTLIKPFISVKFSHKLHLIHSLQDLAQVLPMDRVHIPDVIRRYDDALHV